MFGHQFYPTPSNVAQQMVAAAGGDLSKAVVLDPSGGRGDLLDCARWTGKAKEARLYACEIDPDLANIIRGKKYTVLANDFLQFAGRPDINVILMNPPFDNGAKHLLHAWQILHEGVIVCLLNSQSIHNVNDDTKERLRALITDHNGEVTDMGPAFATADRKTNVDVTMVVLHKQSASAFNWGNFDTRQDEDCNIDAESGLAPRDAIKARVNAYNYGTRVLADAMKGILKAAQILDPLFKDSRGSSSTLPIIIECMAPRQGVQNADINAAMDTITRSAWLDVFSATKIGGMVPSNLLADLNAKKDGMSRMAFTEANIWSLLETLYNNGESLREAAIMRGFELMTKYNEKNRVAEKTWKTNSAFKVRQKFIMGNWAAGYTVTNHMRHDDMNDIDKAMCALTGKPFERIVQLKHLRNSRQEWVNGERVFVVDPTQKVDDKGNPIPNHFQSEFFDVIMYPGVGSAHVTFRDPVLWQQFNIAVAKQNRWLPDEGETGTRYNTKKSTKSKRQL